jgi:hypothetical protein
VLKSPPIANLQNVMQHYKNIEMKSIKLFYLLVLVFTTTFSVNAENHRHEILVDCDVNCKHEEKTNSQIVYVCTGSYAYAYHSRSDCPGLGNCKGEIKYTDENYAVNGLSRVPCCRCWSNVTGRCKDDNPYYGGSGGGGDNSEAYAYVALAVVVASAAILSNDIYIYPTYSFYKSNNSYDPYSGVSNVSNSTGWLFGFRKTFKHSALEYGASYLKSKVDYNYGWGYTYSDYIDRWGGHFNFVHQVFYNKTPQWLKIYLGPSVNYVYDFGYGGIIGTEMKLFDRLRFDVRYEWTTQTNQIQAGLIFTYQKKYFWQK